VAKSLEFHPAAAIEAEQATAWYLERSPHAAGQFVDLRDLAFVVKRLSSTLKS